MICRWPTGAGTPSAPPEACQSTLHPHVVHIPAQCTECKSAVRPQPPDRLCYPMCIVIIDCGAWVGGGGGGVVRWHGRGDRVSWSTGWGVGGLIMPAVTLRMTRVMGTVLAANNLLWIDSIGILRYRTGYNSQKIPQLTHHRIGPHTTPPSSCHHTPIQLPTLPVLPGQDLPVVSLPSSHPALQLTYCSSRLIEGWSL
jgi:hypothetical protein